ncbi:MAG: tRNA (adenosine(37)-N6)-threonylcarbamoyltransferase complex dimerization subunit type 1 TsaB [Pseudomonadota bacterium]
MHVLAVDTSTRCGAVGIAKDGIPIAEISLLSQENHSARLLPAIDWVLEAARLTLAEIDGFGVVTGPGSFTGLRVGLATIKGLAWAERKPVAALESLRVLAQAFVSTDRSVVPMLDARKGRVWAAVYRWSGGQLITSVPPADVSVTDLMARLPEGAVFLGDGARRYGEEIRSALGETALFAPAWFDVPRGGIAAAMAWESIRNGETSDIVSLEPNYLRLSEAELHDQKLGK